MTNPWLRGDQVNWINAPQNEGVYHMYVKDILLDGYKTWHSTKSHNLFICPVVNAILEVPLFASVHKDKLVWEDDKNRCYSVKFGYYLEMSHIVHSERLHVIGDLNGIWKSQASHIACHLLWRDFVGDISQ
jgi:hypothetical protein